MYSVLCRCVLCVICVGVRCAQFEVYASVRCVCVQCECAALTTESPHQLGRETARGTLGQAIWSEGVVTGEDATSRVVASLVTS